MSEKRLRLISLAAELAADFAIRAGEHDRDNSFPVENVARMKECGYTALVIPETHGGLGADLEDYVLCQEQLAQGCAATALAINMHLFGLGSMVERITGEPEGPEQSLFLDAIGRGKQILGGGLSEPETGGDWGVFATTARRDGEFYILNGRKTFTSLSPVIDLFMVMATIEDSSPPASATFVIPRAVPGLQLIETWDAMGMRATASHDLVIKDVRVPAIAMSQSRPVGPVGLYRGCDRCAQIHPGIRRTVPAAHPAASHQVPARHPVCRGGSRYLDRAIASAVREPCAPVPVTNGLVQGRNRAGPIGDGEIRRHQQCDSRGRLLHGGGRGTRHVEEISDGTLLPRCARGGEPSAVQRAGPRIDRQSGVGDRSRRNTALVELARSNKICGPPICRLSSTARFQ